mmetsp:Transcript_21721/g.54705  ORF Transcript_21721/g.54705 Transcript_21721/m.54705 type:complete len:207 (-) Transcript_21721:1437-2057(-)
MTANRLLLSIIQAARGNTGTYRSRQQGSDHRSCRARVSVTTGGSSVVGEAVTELAGTTTGTRRGERRRGERASSDDHLHLAAVLPRAVLCGTPRRERLNAAVATQDRSRHGHWHPRGGRPAPCRAGPSCAAGRDGGGSGEPIGRGGRRGRRPSSSAAAESAGTGYRLTRCRSAGNVPQAVFSPPPREGGGERTPPSTCQQRLPNDD